MHYTQYSLQSRPLQIYNLRTNFRSKRTLFAQEARGGFFFASPEEHELNGVNEKLIMLLRKFADEFFKLHKQWKAQKFSGEKLQHKLKIEIKSIQFVSVFWFFFHSLSRVFLSLFARLKQNFRCERVTTWMVSSRVLIVSLRKIE